MFGEGSPFVEIKEIYEFKNKKVSRDIKIEASVLPPTKNPALRDK